jgi:hypothetical protein
MKYFLILSLLINVVLTFILLTSEPQKEVRERLIIETHAKGPREEVKTIEKKSSTSLKKKKTDSPEMVMGPGPDPQEVQEAAEEMEEARMTFFTETLGVREEEIAEHNRLRHEFFKKTSQFWQNNPTLEPSFEERKKLIKMEEDFHAQLEKLYGKSRWEKYQKFRNNYNQKGYKKQMEENQPFIFMGL